MDKDKLFPMVLELIKNDFLEKVEKVLNSHHENPEAYDRLFKNLEKEEKKFIKAIATKKDKIEYLNACNNKLKKTILDLITIATTLVFLYEDPFINSIINEQE